MEFANIPLKWAGPIKFHYEHLEESLKVPLATFESPLFASVNRGAKLSCHTEGIRTVVVDDRMSRSIVVETQTAEEAYRIKQDLEQRKAEIAQIVESSSRFAKFLTLHFQIVGRLLYLRLECSTGDASGHNMTTKAADQLMRWLLSEYPTATYVSISGNYCCDKKVSAVNGILGRGKYVIAEIEIPTDICITCLKASPQEIAKINIEKNLIGSILSGSLRSANAHFANMLLAIYLATGQDAANIVEGSQGITHAVANSQGLYFSVTLFNVIVGTVGNGKDLPFAQNNLKALGCLEERRTGDNAKRLAAIIAATVLCGELSLLAALTQPGELMRSHEILERKKR